jgi:hypothetical protein
LVAGPAAIFFGFGGAAALRASPAPARPRSAPRRRRCGELDKETVAGGFDDAAPMLADFRFPEFTANRTQCREGALFVLAHQPPE